MPRDDTFNIDASTVPSFLSAVISQSPNTHFYNTTIRNSKDVRILFDSIFLNIEKGILLWGGICWERRQELYYCI